jgi:hypothetical protein
MLNFSTFLLTILFLIHPLQSIFSQEKENWQKETEDRFILFLNNPAKQTDINKIRIQLWTVSPGMTVTTAFGHSALRVFYGEEFGKNDFYVDFGVYDPSPSFFWRFLKGDAAFFVNIIPTSSAYQTWDESGRGVVTTELLIDSNTKKKVLTEILNTYNKYKIGYTYENFTQNCVTFIREILGNGLGKALAITNIDSEKNTWRQRVLPYSTAIFWLNINETLLFDHDTDKVRTGHDLIYLPDDLMLALQELQESTPQESKVLLKDRWLDKAGYSTAIWNVVFLLILGFSIPISFLRMFERFPEVLYGLISVVGGTVALLVYLFTSFSFMDETIVWLIYSPLDFILFRAYDKWVNKKWILSIVLVRLAMLLVALILSLSLYQQNVANILFLSSIFYIFYAYKRKGDIISYFGLNRSRQ